MVEVQIKFKEKLVIYVITLLEPSIYGCFHTRIFALGILWEFFVPI